MARRQRHNIAAIGAVDDLLQLLPPALHRSAFLGVARMPVVNSSNAAFGMIEKLGNDDAVDA